MMDRAKQLSRAMGCRIATVGLILWSGCETTPSLTFEPADYRVSQAQWRFQGKPGKHLVTDHFDIFTTVSDAELRDYLPAFLETTFQLYTSLMPPPDRALKEGAHMQTYLLDNRAEWERFVKTRFANRYPIYRKISAGGFSEGATCVVYDIGRAATWSVLAHEGWHQYVASRFTSPIPAWLNEGLATYCESVEFHNDKPYFRPERNTFRIDDLRDAIISGTALPLDTLLRTNAGEVIDGKRVAATNAYYAQAWALTAFIRHGAEGRYASALEAIAEDIRNGTIRIKAQAARVTSPRPSETSYGQAVFLAYITNDLDAFERDFNAYVKRLCWNK